MRDGGLLLLRDHGRLLLRRRGQLLLRDRGQLLLRDRGQLLVLLRCRHVLGGHGFLVVFFIFLARTALHDAPAQSLILLRARVEVCGENRFFEFFHHKAEGGHVEPDINQGCLQIARLGWAQDRRKGSAILIPPNAFIPELGTLWFFDGLGLLLLGSITNGTKQHPQTFISDKKLFD